MINEISFLRENWTGPILVAAVILVAVYVWKEGADRNKKRIVSKIFVALLVITCLVMMALKPAVPERNDITLGAILTEGYNNFQLDSLRSLHKDLKKLSYDPKKPFQEEIKLMDSVFVLGMGIRDFDLWQLDEVTPIFLGGQNPEGIIKLAYDQKLSVNEQLEITGLINRPEGGVRLFLNGMGGMALDSVELNAEENQRFQLKTRVEVAGNYLFSLVEKDASGRELSSEPIPVKIKDKNPLRIFILNAFPTFETKYLKNFLAEKGHHVVAKSQVTRGRYKLEFFNTKRRAVNILSEEQLESFDLLIIDATSYRSLSHREKRALGNSVQKGLGVLIQSDNSYFNSPGQLENLEFRRDAAMEASLADFPEVAIEKAPLLFTKQLTLQPIHGTNERIYSAAKQVGGGRFGATLFQNTWKLLLVGESTVYQHLWTGLIEKLGRQESALTHWEATTFGFQDEPFVFRLRTSLPDPEVKNSEGSIIPLKRLVETSNLWEGITFPREKGWNELVLQQDSTEVFTYYVADSSKWQGLVAYRTMEENVRYSNKKEREMVVKKELKAVSPIWFFIIFLVGMGYLWVEPRL